jgi:hypothetical protein
MFGHGFGEKIDRYAMLVDSKNNEFEVMVERNNGAIFLTKGWHAMRDFYGIVPGAWVTIVFVGNGKFAITLKDRFGRTMPSPKFTPAVIFEVEKQVLPFHVFNVVQYRVKHIEERCP